MNMMNTSKGIPPTPTPGRRPHGRRIITWMAPLALLAAVFAAAGAGVMLINQDIQGMVQRALAGSLRGSATSVRVGNASLVLPGSVQMERVQVEVDSQASVYVPGIRVGFDVPQMVTRLGHPERALRRVEADGIVIRPILDPGKDGTADAGPGEAGQTPADIAAYLEEARSFTLQALQALDGGLFFWVEAGDALSWDLQGVWEAAAQQPSLSWHTTGELRAQPDGRVVADGTLSAGTMKARFTASGRKGELAVEHLVVELPDGHVQGKVSARTTGADDTLTVELSASGDLAFAEAGVSFSGDVTASGPWRRGALPPVHVALTLGEPDSGMAPWAAPMKGTRLAAVIQERPDGLEIRDGRLAKAEGQGTFSGRVAGAWPYETRLAIEASRLRPGKDVPWWDAYDVPSVAMRGQVAGSASDPWTIEGEIQLPGGTLLGVPVSGTAGRVSVDFGRQSLSLRGVEASVGQSGAITIEVDVGWVDASPPTPDGRPTRATLVVRGRLEDAASVDVVEAMRMAFQPPSGLQGSSPAQDAAQGMRPDTAQKSVAAFAAAFTGEAGAVTGDFDATLSWSVSDTGTAVELVNGRFDGPDGTIEATLDGPRAYRLSAQQVNLGGRALRPWLPPQVSGFAEASGRLAGDRLVAQLRLARLSIGAWDLGSLVTPVDRSGSTWIVGPARFSGGQVAGEFSARAELGGPVLEAGATVNLRQSADQPLQASVQGGLTLAGGSLAFDDLRVGVRGQDVARVRGSVPLVRSGASPGAGMDVRITMVQFPLELVQVFVPAWQVTGGRLSGEVLVGGSIDSPTAQGQMRVNADRIESAQQLLNPLQDVTLEVGISGGTLRISEGRASSAAGGQVVLSGGAELVSLWPVTFSPVDLRLNLESAGLSARPAESVELRGIWNGSLSLRGTLGESSVPRLTGDVSVKSGRVVLWGAATWLSPTGGAGGGKAAAGPAPKAPAPPGAERPGGEAAGIPLEVKLRAEDPVRIEIPAASGTALVEGELVLIGTTGEPALEGSLSLSQARLRYFGREFVIDQGRIDFSRARGVRPVVEFEASTSSTEGPVRLDVEGDPSNTASLRLSSDPPLSRQELLALLLPPPGSGGSVVQWTERVNEQLAAWAMSPIEQAVRDALGLDELWLVPMTREGRLLLTLGKYLSPQRAYVRYNRSIPDSAGDQVVELSFKLNPGLTWQFSWSREQGLGVGARWQLSF